MVKAGRGDNVRLLRVGEAIRHALAAILARDELRDPELSGAAITVSAVEVSPDLRHAEVFVMPLLGRNSEAVIAALNRNAPRLRAGVARAVTLKYLPRLVFRGDDSFDEAERVETLLRSERVRRDLG